MKQPYEIVHSVFEAFRSLPVKIAAMSGKTEQWYRSHGAEPRTLNPLSSGNVSPVTHYMQYCRQFEGAIRGAGRVLASRVHDALEAEFAENGLLDLDQSDLRVGVLDESCDVSKWLAKHDIENASKGDLLVFENECDEAIEIISQARARARVLIKEWELKRSKLSAA